MFMKKDSIESSKFQVSTILALGLSILRFFFTSSDSNLYNSIATAIDPDASCIANLLTHMSSKGSEKVQDINIFSIS